MLDVYTDALFTEPALAKLKYHAEHNHPAYFYTFDHYPAGQSNIHFLKRDAF